MPSSTGRATPTRLADLAVGKLRVKIPALHEALQGAITEHHRFLLRRLLTQLAFLEEEIASFDRQIAEATAPFAAMLTRLDGIPGVDATSGREPPGGSGA